MNTAIKSSFIVASVGSRKKLFSFLYASLLLLLTLLSTSCKSKKVVADNREPLKNRSVEYLLEKYEANKLYPEWTGMKLDVSFDANGESQSFKATVRMKRDSAVWVSITPLLGIEMIRLLITPDTLKLLSKLPDNKYYFIGSPQQVGTKLGIELDFDMLQSLLLGNAIGLESEENKFRSEIDGNEYQLISKHKRRIKRLAEADMRSSEMDSLLRNNEDHHYERAMRQLDSGEVVIVSKYWLESDNYRLVKSVFSDIVNKRTVDIRYSKFSSVADMLYPSRCEVRVSDVQNKIMLNLDIGKVNFQNSYDFPFEIPNDYPRRDSL